MLRLLVLVLGLAIGSTAAEAQVFRPKAGAKKAPAPAAKAAPATAKKQPRTAPPKKRPAKKKNAAAAADEESAPAPKETGKDYVKIWDDEEIE